MTKHGGSTTYPGNWQNGLKETKDFYKDLMLLNQPSGYIEWVNSKGIEALNIFGKSGSGISIASKQFSLVSTKDFKANFLSDVNMESKGNITIHSDKDVNIVSLGDEMHITGDADKWQKYFDAIKEILKPLHQKKLLFENKRTKFHNAMDQSSLQTKSGSLVACPIETVEIKILKTSQSMEWTPYKYSPGSRTLAILKDNVDEYAIFSGSGGNSADDGFFCLTCNGTHESPSTQDGDFTVESIKAQIESEMVNLTTKLADQEKFLGQNKKPSGGDKINKTSKNRMDIVGLTFNDLQSHRVDPVGRLIPNNLVIDPLGGSVYKTYRASPLIERVHVDDMPGGDYVMNIGNSCNWNVGSNGLNIKTSGSFDMFGVTMRILSQQTQINTRHNLELTSGDSLFISSPNIVIKPIVTEFEIENSSGGIRSLPANGKTKTEPLGQVLVDGNLGIVGNVIIKGGLHVEGELTLQHLTMPMEYHITEEDFEFGQSVPCSSIVVGEEDCATPKMGPTYIDMVPGCLIGKCIISSGSSAGTWPVFSILAPSCGLVHPHHHKMKMPAMRLIRGEEEVKTKYGNVEKTKTLNPHDMSRAIGARNNSMKPVLAKSVLNSKSNNTSVEKFGNSNCGEPITIDNSDWEDPCIADSLPIGDGMGTSKSADNVINKALKQNSTYGSKKAVDFTKKLAKVTEERKNHETFLQT